LQATTLCDSESLESLKAQGMKKLIVDFGKGNSGGYDAVPLINMLD